MYKFKVKVKVKW